MVKVFRIGFQSTSNAFSSQKNGIMVKSRFLHNLWPFDPACRWTEFIQVPENDFILCFMYMYIRLI